MEKNPVLFRWIFHLYKVPVSSQVPLVQALLVLIYSVNTVQKIQLIRLSNNILAEERRIMISFLSNRS